MPVAARKAGKILKRKRNRRKNVGSIFSTGFLYYTQNEVEGGDFFGELYEGGVICVSAVKNG